MVILTVLPYQNQAKAILYCGIRANTIVEFYAAVLLTVVGAVLPRELYLGLALKPFYCHIPTPSFIIIALSVKAH